MALALQESNIAGIDPHAPQPDLHAAIKSSCKALLPGWAVLTDADIAVTRIAGGISNALFKVCPAAAAALAPVALRLYGDNTELFVDRGQEVATMRLVQQHGFGPRVGVSLARACWVPTLGHLGNV